MELNSQLTMVLAVSLSMMQHLILLLIQTSIPISSLLQFSQRVPFLQMQLVQHMLLNYGVLVRKHGVMQVLQQ